MIAEQLIEKNWTPAATDPDVTAWAGVADPDFEDLKMSVYAAQVECMDRNIGRVLSWLSDREIENQTLVMFLSDNGGDGAPENFTPELPPGVPNSSYIYGRGWARLSNTPLRGYKRETYEGGIATPFIAVWPSVIASGRTAHQPAHVIDVMATCLEAAGATYPSTYHGRPVLPHEGRSLMAEFRGDVNFRAPPERMLFWEHEGYRAVREVQWKLVAPHGGLWELFDLAADRGETRNLAEQRPDIVQRLSDAYATWAARCGVVDWQTLSPR
jgi:arylsulfatase